MAYLSIAVHDSVSADVVVGLDFFSSEASSKKPNKASSTAIGDGVIHIFLGKYVYRHLVISKQHCSICFWLKLAKSENLTIIYMQPSQHFLVLVCRVVWEFSFSDFEIFEVQMKLHTVNTGF